MQAPANQRSPWPVQQPVAGKHVQPTRHTGRPRGAQRLTSSDSSCPGLEICQRVRLLQGSALVKAEHGTHAHSAVVKLTVHRVRSRERRGVMERQEVSALLAVGRRSTLRIQRPSHHLERGAYDR